MKFTGEFFIPQDDEDSGNDHGELEIEHKQRYLSILDLVEGKTVLDIASGEGYGTSILSAKASQITAVDINPDLIRHASQKYGSANTRFLQGSVEKIPLEANSVDVIVSFETLEHVDASIQELFFNEAKRVLRPDGILIISTPNKKNYTDRYKHYNKFHLNELYEKEFEEALKRHFGFVQLYDQGLEVSSMILNKDHYLSQKPLTVLPINNTYNFEGKYLIAVCSDSAQSAQIPIASIVPESEKTYFQLIDRILALQKEVEELGSWGTRSAAEIESLLKERATLIDEKAALMDEKSGVAEALTSSRNELEGLMNERTDLLNDRELAHQRIGYQDRMIEIMQAELAQSRHEKFLVEAEIAAVREVTKKRYHNSDLTAYTDSIAILTNSLSQKELNGTAYHKAPAVPGITGQPTEANASPLEDLNRQIATLQEHIQWYKRTYEERGFLGVIRQKISNKFSK